MFSTLLIFTFLTYNLKARILNDDEKIEAVKVHNLVRRSVVPEASDMKELEYSDEIALVASQYLEKCKFTHMYGHQGYGENGRLATDSNITKSIMNWFQERVYYDWTKPYGERCYVRRNEDNYLSTATCGHYTMVTTSTVSKVGCAINYCPSITIPNQNSIENAYLIFCFYDKGPRDYPYTPGRPCTGCNDMSASYCRDGLCVKKSTSNDECKVVCKRCQSLPSWIPGFCSCDCEVGEDNDCSGTDVHTKDPFGCNSCDSLGIPCLNGGKDVSTNRVQCQCFCPEGYAGNNCESTPKIQNDIKNSATINVYGEQWYFGFTYPLDKYEFRRKWDAEYKERIRNDIDEFCKNSECGEFGKTNSASSVEMVEDYPIIDERGTLILKIFVKRNEHYLNKTKVQEVIVKKAGKEASYLFGYVNIDL